MTLEEALYQERLQNRQLNDLIQADPPTGGEDLAQRMRATKAGLQLPPPDPPDLSGWSDAPDAGGLGLASRDRLPDPAPAASGLSLGDVIGGLGSALEAGSAGFFGRTPLYMQQQMMEADLQAKREARALQVRELEERKRQHDLGLLEKAMNDPRQLEALGAMQGFSLAPQAKMLSKTLKESDAGSIAAYREFIPEEIQQRFLQGSLPSHELSAWLDQARTEAKESAKANAKAMIVQRAQNKPAEQRTPYETQLVEEAKAKLEVSQADTELKKAQAAKARMEAERGPIDNSNLEKIHEMVSGGKSWRMGTPQTQQKALDEYARLMPEGRTNVMLGTPIPVEKRSNLIDRNEFLKHDKLVNPPQGATEGATRSGSYVEMTDRQREDWGNLVNSGATLQTLFDEVEPLVTATNSAQAAKQFARLHLEAATKKNPQAATYLADSEAFSSRMARVFGSEVGVLTNPDVERWRRALPTFGDTKQVLAEKKRIFMSIYKQTKDMYKKKIAGEDYSEDLVGLRRGPLKEVDKIAPPSVNDDFNAFFGGK